MLLRGHCTSLMLLYVTLTVVKMMDTIVSAVLREVDKLLTLLNALARLCCVPKWYQSVPKYPHLYPNFVLRLYWATISLSLGNGL